MSVQREMDEPIRYGDSAVTGGVSVFDERFDELFGYDGDDLGLSYAPEQSSFRLWAPTSEQAELVLYASWQGEPERVISMDRGTGGTWTASVTGDLEGKYYTYRVLIEGQWNEAVDPYARAVGVNGDRGAILDLRKTDPEGWSARMPAFGDPVDAVIYELHVMDYSIHPESGIRHKGLFAGLAESGTRGPGGILTGLDHIADLGVTHVQLLPVYDYATESVDETKLDLPHYNWGYDPKNYNVPEGSYATDPYEPASRIRELKELIQSLHDRGVRVIMDVVYNHVYDGYRVNFTKLVPGYYLRYKPDGSLANGSGCGNDCATERKMMSRFIADSVLYWAKEYKFDGFRFDLMGLMDVDTINEIRRRISAEIDPSILMIGEGWDLATELAPERQASQHNSEAIPLIGQFNDRFRDVVKGDIFLFDVKGFVSGGPVPKQEVMAGIAGGIPYAPGIHQFVQEPQQSVNYVECHDNHTLWDKLVLSAGEVTEAELRAMHRLATAMILLSQGIPFLHAGQEFMRTKNGVENSYKSPVEINRIDWERCAALQDEVAYVKKLIGLRRAHPAFRMRSAEEIRAKLVFEASPADVIAYTLRGHAGGDQAEHLLVIYSAVPGEVALPIPKLGSWQPLLGAESISALEDGKITISGIGVTVLAVL